MILTSSPPDQIPTIPGLITATVLLILWAVSSWVRVRRTP